MYLHRVLQRPESWGRGMSPYVWWLYRAQTEAATPG